MTPLYTPMSMKNAAPQLLKDVCNGCGTEGWKGKLVPDSILGLTITPACQIHDWQYHEGETDADKKVADRIFLHNMVRIINNHGGFFTRWRLLRAKEYYLSVKYFGGDSFWGNKNSLENEVVEKSAFFDFEKD